MQRIPVDTRGITFQAASEVTPALDFESRQQRSDESSRPLWQVQVLVTAPDSMSIERIRFAVPTAPIFKVGQALSVTGLVATPYVNGQRAAISFKAEAVSATKSA
jgi:hypothetical protein